MCGIAGFYKAGSIAEPSQVRAMCDAIRHRGPDDDGIHVDGGCGIGMRRLSIIDLSTGHQPIPNEDGSVWIVFNGEIYNYREIRDWLISKGHRFKTASDTETIVHLYEEVGEEAPARLRGMFAFAIWDARRKELFITRDRFGKKPLYWSADSHGVYFGSELKCLRAAGVPLEMDPDALRWYFQFNYIPDPLTAYRGVRRLPAAGWMKFSEQGVVSQGTYWKLPPPAERPPEGLTRQDACEQLCELFDESVRLRLMADVPLGAFLSGGLDSSMVVASMARQTSQPVKTFSIGFAEAAFNETPYAAEVAKLYKTDHHEVLVKPDSISLLQRLVHHFDEPFGDSSAVPTFAVSEFAVRNVKVALSGDGGDELFGGYTSFFLTNRLRWTDHIPKPVRALLSAFAGALPYSAYGKNYLRMIGRPGPLDRYFESNYAPYFLRERLLTPDWMLPGESGLIARTFSQNMLGDDADILTRAMYWEATGNLTGDMLVKVDRMSMANSLEVRCPLLDHKLAEFAATLPHEWKISGNTGKMILREAMGSRLPPQLLNLPKKGFGAPLEVWFRTSLREFLWDHLTSRTFLDRGIVREAFLRQLLDEHHRGRRNNSHWLWQLLMLELWFRAQEPGREFRAA